MQSTPNRHSRRAAAAKARQAADAQAAAPEENGSAKPGPLLSEYLTPDELANELDVCLETIKRWRRLGRGPPVTLIGRFPYYLRTSVILWLRNSEQSAA